MPASSRACAMGAPGVDGTVGPWACGQIVVALSLFGPHHIAAGIALGALVAGKVRRPPSRCRQSATLRAAATRPRLGACAHALAASSAGPAQPGTGSARLRPIVGRLQLLLGTNVIAQALRSSIEVLLPAVLQLLLQVSLVGRHGCHSGLCQRPRDLGQRPVVRAAACCGAERAMPVDSLGCGGNGGDKDGLRFAFCSAFRSRCKRFRSRNFVFCRRSSPKRRKQPPRPPPPPPRLPHAQMRTHARGRREKSDTVASTHAGMTW